MKPFSVKMLLAITFSLISCGVASAQPPPPPGFTVDFDDLKGYVEGTRTLDNFYGTFFEDGEETSFESEFTITNTGASADVYYVKKREELISGTWTESWTSTSSDITIGTNGTATIPVDEVTSDTQTTYRISVKVYKSADDSLIDSKIHQFVEETF